MNGKISIRHGSQNPLNVSHDSADFFCHLAHACCHGAKFITGTVVHLHRQISHHHLFHGRLDDLHRYGDAHAQAQSQNNRNDKRHCRNDNAGRQKSVQLKHLIIKIILAGGPNLCICLIQNCGIFFHHRYVFIMNNLPRCLIPLFGTQSRLLHHLLPDASIIRHQGQELLQKSGISLIVPGQRLHTCTDIGNILINNL